MNSVSDLTWQIMFVIVLPCVIAGILLGTLVLASCSLDDPGQEDAALDMTRKTAWAGLALSALIVVILVVVFLVMMIVEVSQTPVSDMILGVSRP